MPAQHARFSGRTHISINNLDNDSDESDKADGRGP